jgi:wyosine [tRNA(Phe)-imidazoG37] synthetase (radical SAM superfamily)
MKSPCILASDEKGNIFEIPNLAMTGMSGNKAVIPDHDDLIELPFGSNLFMLPDRIPIGFDKKTKRFVALESYNGRKIFAVAAFMAPSYLQILRSAYDSNPNAQRLSLYSYTAAGWHNDRFVAAGMRIDRDKRQDLNLVDRKIVDQKAFEMKEKFKGNRLVGHLVDNCVCCYGCPAARNFVLGRWECPVPTSVSCNSKCVGCISKQPESSGVSSSQDRLGFVPEVSEIIEFTVPHLEQAERAVISFGQGCEGEPLSVSGVIEEAIREIRRKTSRGIINLNTNGSMPDNVERLLKAGLDSIRVSLNSARESYYNLYFNPVHYRFTDVMETLDIVRKYGRWVSINYFMFPGFTDTEEEIAALEKIIVSKKINMIQTRNINIDPEWYLSALGITEKQENAIGIRGWVNRIRDRFPWIRLGYFNPPREEMKNEHFDFIE